VRLFADESLVGKPLANDLSHGDDETLAIIQWIARTILAVVEAFAVFGPFRFSA
jgi:hypothetical protein